jgi:predicted  nucleic acid-binding Zn-ribbon protein
MSDQNSNGFTTKQYLELIKEGQAELKQELKSINQRIDVLHEKVNAKIDKSEFYKTLLLIGTVISIVGAFALGV